MATATPDMTTVPVYDFLDDAGRVIGCGTKAELDYWTEEGVMTGVTLGAVIAHEPAEMDERRKVAWAKAA